MKKPLIGVVPLYDSEKESFWMLPGYMDGIEAAGGIPVMLPMTADAVNLSFEPKSAFLRAAEAGCGLSYTLTARYDKSLMSAKQTLYHSTVFSGLDGGIYETVAAYNAYFESIKNAKIISHKILENGLRNTEFD